MATKHPFPPPQTGVFKLQKHVVTSSTKQEARDYTMKGARLPKDTVLSIIDVEPDNAVEHYPASLLTCLTPNGEVAYIHAFNGFIAKQFKPL